MREQDALEIKQLKEKYSYLDKMPDCTEKYVIQLYLHFQILEISESEEIYISDIDRLVKKLAESVAVEKINNENLSACIPLMQQQAPLIQDVINLLQNALKDIQPLDAPWMLQLLDETQSAAEKIKDKPVVALFGLTGAGKSTTLHYLAGATMTVVEPEEGIFRIEHAYQDNDRHDQNLSKVAIGHSSVNSETRYIQPVDIQYQTEVGMQSLTICDIPGINDTDGAERDIVNGNNLVNALRDAQSVKPVVVISMAGIGDKAQGLQGLMATIVKFIPEFDKNKETISYLFTKTEGMTGAAIHNKLKNLLRDLPRATDKNIRALLTHMVAATQDSSKVQSLAFSKNTTIPAQQRISFLENFRTSPVIASEAEGFKRFFAHESETKLELKLNQSTVRIQEALARGDSDIAIYELQLLKRLNNHLGKQFDKVKTTYETRVNLVKETLVKALEETAELGKELLSDTLTQASAARVVGKYKTIAETMVKYEPIRKAMFSTEFDKDLIEQALQPLLEAMNKAVSEIEESTDVERIAKSAMKIVRISGVSSAFQGMDAVAKMATSSELAKASVAVKFKKYMEDAQKAIGAGNLETYAASLLAAETLAHHCSSLLEEPQAAIVALKNESEKAVHAKIRAAFMCLAVSKIALADAQAIPSALKMLEKLNNSAKGLFQGLDEVTVMRLREQFNIARNSLVNKTVKEISDVLQKPKSIIASHAKEMKQNILTLKLLQADVSDDVSDKYGEVIKNVQNIAGNLNVSCASYLNKLLTEAIGVDVYVEALNNLYQIESMLPEDNQKTFFDIGKKNAIKTLIALDNRHQAIRNINELFKNECDPLFPEMVDAQKMILNEFSTELDSALSNAEASLGEFIKNLGEEGGANKFLLQIEDIRKLLKKLNELKQQTFKDNAAYLKDSFDSFGQCLNALIIFQQSLKNESEHKVESVFVSMPQLHYFSKVAESLTGLDKFMPVDGRFSVACQDIKNTFARCESDVNKLCDYSSSHEEYDTWTMNIRLNRAAKLAWASNKAVEIARVDLNLSHLDKYPVSAMKVSLNYLSIKMDNQSYSARADQLLSFVVTQLNSILSNIPLCEHAEGERLLNQVVSIRSMLKEEPDALADLDANISQATTKVDNILEAEDTELNLAKNSIEKLYKLMHKSYEAFKFNLMIKAKNKIEGHLIQKMNDLNQRVADMISSGKQCGELLQSYDAINTEYHAFHEAINQCRSYSNESIKSCFYQHNSACESTVNVDACHDALSKNINDSWYSSVQLMMNVDTINKVSHHNLIAKVNFNPSGFFNTKQNLFQKCADLSDEKIEFVMNASVASFNQLIRRVYELIDSYCISKEVDFLLFKMKNLDSILKDMKYHLSKYSNSLSYLVGYDDLSKHVTKAFVQWEKDLSVSFFENNELQAQAQVSHRIYFEKLFLICCAYSNLNLIQSHVNMTQLSPNFSPIAEIQVSLEHLVVVLQNFAINAVNKEEDEYNIFTVQYNWLSEIGRKIEIDVIKKAVLSSQVLIKECLLGSVENKIQNAIRNVDNDAMEPDAIVQRLADNLISIKFMAFLMPPFANHLNKLIDDALESCYERNAGIIPPLASYLQTYPDENRMMYAKYMLIDHDVLSGHKHFLFNTASKLKNTENDVNALIEAKETYNQNELQQQFTLLMKEYKALYRSAVESGQSINDELKKLVEETKQIPGNSKSYKEKVRSILARLFAYWTVEDSAYYIKHSSNKTADEKRELEKYLRQPRDSQVTAILRLLEMDMSDEVMNFLFTGKGSVYYYLKTAYTELKKFTGLSSHSESTTGSKADPEQDLANLSNHLVEIETGGGKSLTLGMLSAVFAIMGQPVHCGCYSEYLSQRDFDQFKGVFEKFGVADKIVYGTFEELCENVINQKVDIRSEVMSLFFPSDSRIGPLKTKKEERVTQLLIDEIDKLFTDFYGRQYRPKVMLKDPVITNLIMMMWKNRNNSDYEKLETIQKSSQYAACSDKFTGWNELLLESVKSMVVALRTMKNLNNKNVSAEIKNSYNYVVNKEGRIGYVMDDGIQYHQVRGFSTVFAYIEEHEKKSYEHSKTILDENIGIYLNCGEFSYIEMLGKYLHMRGVTATLDGLSSDMQAILESKFGFRQTTKLLSVFPDRETRFKFDPEKDVYVVSDDEYFDKIAELNEQAIYKDGQKRTGAAIVFFEDEFILKQFLSNERFKRSGNGEIHRKAKTLTAATEPEFRNSLVMSAASRGQNTLATHEFTRGTDFVCNDPRLVDGMLIISGYFPATNADELQLKGRTARGGLNGSMKMVIRASDLIKDFGMSQSEVEIYKTKAGQKSAYSNIVKARDKIEKAKLNKGLAAAKVNEEAHRKSENFVDALANKNLEKIRDYLLEQNREHNFHTGSPFCTVMMLDATGSMRDMIEKAKEAISIMFQQGRSILRDRQYNPDLFVLRIVVYRNYNSRIPVAFSDAHTDPVKLTEWLTTVEARDGIDVEAGELALQRINYWQDMAEKNSSASHDPNRLPIKHVVILADIGMNTAEQTDQHRMSRSEWRSLNDELLKCPAYFNEELSKLVHRKIKVHAFSLNSNGDVFLNAVTKTANSEFNKLNVNDASATTTLKNFVATKILADIGGSDLVAAFNAKYNNGGYVVQSKGKGKAAEPVSKPMVVGYPSSSSSSALSSSSVTYKPQPSTHNGGK